MKSDLRRVSDRSDEHSQGTRLEAEDWNDWLDRGVHPARTLDAAHPAAPKFQKRWTEANYRQLQGLWRMRDNDEWERRSLATELTLEAVEAARADAVDNRSAPLAPALVATAGMQQGAASTPADGSALLVGASVLTMPYSQCAARPVARLFSHHP